MNVISEEVVRTWNTAETTELKELREYKKYGGWACGVLAIETAVLSVVFAAAVFFMWNHVDVPERVAACAACFAFIGIRLCIFAALNDPKSDQVR